MESAAFQNVCTTFSPFLYFVDTFAFFLKEVPSVDENHGTSSSGLCRGTGVREGLCEMSFADAYCSEVRVKVSNEWSGLTGLEIKNCEIQGENGFVSFGM
jgi:hypothetical protein